ncbi:signal transduction histidine kinase [Amycolatopsis lexingtonensis]|uniref:histidine kinase n=1 Tax=Amycolatopsis lexingtonensis TaxID=218822 RepID=A0ABR9I684_9PSEU|nr:sensor histidine kinase [Amycolatopsis lexingtonensis]MBE1498705.1 signal transduction histidine kinase [Amycolatopsis lexingtonensis]
MRIRVVLDVLAVLVLAIGAGGNLAAGAWALPLWLPTWLGWTILLTSVTPILLRRWWPRPAYVLSLVLTAAAVPIGGPVLAVAVVAAGCALYTFVVHRGSRASRIGFAAGLLGVGLLGIVVPNPSTATTVNFGASALIVGFALGIAVHGRREYAAIERENHAREAVSAERLRIAREMHDVVAHSMSLIAVKAAVGNHVALEQPDQAREALRVIEDTSRETLAELRRVLGVLRDGTGVPALAPAPTLADLRALADRAQLTGLSVDLAVEDLDELPAGAGQSVYRIVQEALTNVVKHAAATTCRIRVTGSDGEVAIEVRDDGRGGAVVTPGHGLIGMRERVAVYGGEFSAGPSDDGFRVFARLPYETAAAR